MVRESRGIELYPYTASFDGGRFFFLSAELLNIDSTIRKQPYLIPTNLERGGMRSR